MYCMQCGRALEQSAAKCPECGAAADPRGYCGGFWGLVGETPPRAAAAVPQRTSAPAEKKSWLPILCAVMAVIMLLEFGMILLLRAKGNRLQPPEKPPVQTEDTTAPNQEPQDWQSPSDGQPDDQSNADSGQAPEPGEPTDANPDSGIIPDQGQPDDGQNAPIDEMGDQGGR